MARGAKSMRVKGGLQSGMFLPFLGFLDSLDSLSYLTCFGTYAGNGSVSGVTRTAVVNLNGYLPPLS